MPENRQDPRIQIAAARAAEDLGDYRVAADHYITAGSLVGGAAKAWAYHEAAVAFRRCDDLEAALAASEVATASADLSDDTYLRAQISLITGNVLADAERWAEAIACSVTAREIFESMNAGIESRYARIGEARCFAGMGERAKALDIYRDLATIGHPFEIRSQALDNLALLHIEMSESERALELMREDALLCRQVGDSYGEFVAHVNLSHHLAELNRTNDAKFHARTALALGKKYHQTPPYRIAEKIFKESGR